jgi:hypothetical protein
MYGILIWTLTSQAILSDLISFVLLESSYGSFQGDITFPHIVRLC